MQRSARKNPRRGRKAKRSQGDTSVTRQTVGVVKAGRPLSGMFMPPVFRTSLRFTFSRSSAASTSLGQIAFSGNNVQDPSLTTGAEQPPGFTQLATLYSRYRVIGSSAIVKTTLSTQSASGANGPMSGTVVLYPSNSSGAPSDLEAAISQPLAKWKEVTNSFPTAISKSMNTALMVGQQKMVASDRLQSLVSGAPAEEWYWIVCFQSDFAYTSTNFDWHIQITYDVEFFDRPTINQAFESWKYMKLAYQARCREIEADQAADSKRKQERKDAFRNELFVETKTELSEAAHLKEIQKNLQDIEDFQKLHANVPTLKRQADRWLKVEPENTPSSRSKATSLK